MFPNNCFCLPIHSIAKVVVLRFGLGSAPTQCEGLKQMANYPAIFATPETEEWQREIFHTL